MNEILDEAQQAANPFLVDGATRTKEFVPQHADPSDDAGGPVPDEVWASDEFQDNLYAWTRAQAGPSIKPDDGERKIQYIRPKPGFVFKTVDKASNKIFVNVCSSIQVPEPPKITPEMLQDQKNPVRLPLSLGEAREDTDAKGKPCTVYDCVMHTDVLERTKTDAEMKEFVVELCLQWIEQKHNLLLNRRVKWPKGMDAKGEPEIQTIRRNTNRLFTPVSETTTPEPDPEPVEEQPDYAVSEEDDGRLLVVVSLPKLETADAVELEHSSKRLFVVVKGVYKAAIPLPYAISKSGADAEFNKIRRQLSVWLKIAVQSASEDARNRGGSKQSMKKGRAPEVTIRNSLATELD